MQVPEQVPKLPNRHHPVLLFRQRREPLAAWQSFSTHSV
jgi:hypothetical protein